MATSAPASAAASAVRARSSEPAEREPSARFPGGAPGPCHGQGCQSLQNARGSWEGPGGGSPGVLRWAPWPACGCLLSAGDGCGLGLAALWAPSGPRVPFQGRRRPAAPASGIRTDSQAHSPGGGLGARRPVTRAPLGHPRRGRAGLGPSAALGLPPGLWPCRPDPQLWAGVPAGGSALQRLRAKLYSTRRRFRSRPVRRPATWTVVLGLRVALRTCPRRRGGGRAPCDPAHTAPGSRCPELRDSGTAAWTVRAVRQGRFQKRLGEGALIPGGKPSPALSRAGRAPPCSPGAAGGGKRSRAGTCCPRARAQPGPWAAPQAAVLPEPLPCSPPSPPEPPLTP